MMNKRWIFMLTTMLFLGAFGQQLAAQERTVKDILQHADRARGNLAGIIWDITITTSEEGKDETRGLTVTVKGNNTLARYTSPPNMNDRMVLMVDRNMWFIRSGLKKPVSISPRQKLMGDAANGDIASTNYADDYSGELAGEETVKDEACYVLDLKAATKNVTYDRIRYWVSKARMVGVKAEFYTLSGMLFKTADFRYDNRVKTPDSEEIPFVSELVIRDAIRKDRITMLTYSRIRVQTIPDSTFNLNVLVR
ncbi:MAG: outer membrane lipoprotein-sorting protein [Nitrospirae bacterium]|nr:outer membrane lipoprotein-sorting protein [Nitrospirota bacterium]NTW65964.1 outer membrane lipoprotein-sorting protein [Nitrospirota bacterium]